MKHFDTNIIHFSSLNRCQRHVYLFIAGIRQSLYFLFLNQRPNNNKNKLLYQNKIKKNIKGSKLYNLRDFLSLRTKAHLF
jgi:hypothetical protein